MNTSLAYVLQYKSKTTKYAKHDTNVARGAFQVKNRKAMLAFMKTGAQKQNVVEAQGDILGDAVSLTAHVDFAMHGRGGGSMRLRMKFTGLQPAQYKFVC